MQRFRCVGAIVGNDHVCGWAEPVYALYGKVISDDGFYYTAELRDSDGCIEGFYEKKTIENIFIPIEEELPPVGIGERAYFAVCLKDSASHFHLAVSEYGSLLGKKLVELLRKKRFHSEVYLWYERNIYSLFYAKVTGDLIKEFYEWEHNINWNVNQINLEAMNEYWEKGIFPMYQDSSVNRKYFLFRDFRKEHEFLAVLDGNMMLHIHHLEIGGKTERVPCLKCSEFYSCSGEWDSWRCFVAWKFGMDIITV